MATFSEAQISKIAKIFRTSSDIISYRLGIFAGEITDSDAAEVEAILEQWETEGLDFDVVSISPTNSNEGAKSSPAEARRVIQEMLAGLLHLEALLPSSGVQGFIHRG